MKVMVSWATNLLLTCVWPAAPNEERRFFSFHDWGVSVYEPTACRLYHQIQSTDIIPGTQVQQETKLVFGNIIISWAH